MLGRLRSSSLPQWKGTRPRTRWAEQTPGPDPSPPASHLCLFAASPVATWCSRCQAPISFRAKPCLAPLALLLLPAFAFCICWVNPNPAGASGFQNVFGREERAERRGGQGILAAAVGQLLTPQTHGLPLLLCPDLAMGARAWPGWLPRCDPGWVRMAELKARR